MYYPSLLVSTLTILPLAQCVAFGGPAPTNAIEGVDKAAIGWTPKPTQGPSPAELRARQESETLDAGYNTCGWIGTDGVLGNFSRPVYCSTGRTCALYTSSNIGMAGCCSGSDTQNCGWAKSCVPFDAYTKKSCDNDCMSNNFIWKCSESATPYCVTWTYPDAGVADYACATFNSGVMTVLQTAEDDISVYWKTLSTLSGNAVTGFDEEASSTVESDSTSATSDIFPDLTTSDASDPTNSPNGDDDTTPRPKKKSTPVGAIVGGVVGGLVALFLIGAAIIFFCVKQRKKKALANNQSIIAAQQNHQPPPSHSEFKPPMQQQQYASPPAGVQSPPPQNGFFGAPAPAQDQKINYQVQEQGMQSPVISNPPTPAPAYVQPYYTGQQSAPPMPSEGAAQYPAQDPAPGTYEVDAISSQQQAPPGVQQTRPVQQSNNVYEMGSGR